MGKQLHRCGFPSSACQLSCPARLRVTAAWGSGGRPLLPPAEGMGEVADSHPLPLLSPSYFFLWKLPPLQICLQSGSCGHPLTYFGQPEPDLA